MKIFVTGGTGFIGRQLVPSLVESGHEVLLLVRPGEPVTDLPAGVSTAVGEPMRTGPWWDRVADCQAAVNLAGAPIVGRWDEQKRRLIRDSRVLTTRNLVAAVPATGAFTLVSTSAVGIYGDGGERELDEGAPLGADFLAAVARAWEAEAQGAEAKGARVVVTRFAVVLGRGGGALQKLAAATKGFAGGPLGSGRQWFSWIHMTDLVRSLRFLLENPGETGIFNLCSPYPARQIEMARTLGRVLGRPAFLPAPAFALRLLLGEFADTLLFSQKMIPRRLLDAGFTFRFPQLEPALREILGHQSA